mmetsp:Transcript_38325/g.56468  ORF Transcript_38325/g.56468 Transcript_38325/m.56468 type:complete len:108 (+) Transcript_38325:75-398(+)|eukprot:CAMPEP_0195507476 /NCGR_PEP_ID=MMETSP0794_2-20130614/913_1 /TAXON_ID=515487 /ORGANISM="Stephanopyxis turris, Strain CCMP 815" /LENGTH=107 /DNA_ID=CAMNT_0040634167 /DNA_START=75 /DNA_END=398 /DNA_ORIENTATION=+
MATKSKSPKSKLPRSKSSKAVPASPNSPSGGALKPSGYLLSCDIPAKQLVKKLNDDEPADKKFIIEDLDETHMLIKGWAREKITNAVNKFMDEVNTVCIVWSSYMYV